MKLYIKQNFFAFGDQFSIYDADGNELFYVKSEILTFGKKLHLYTLTGDELAYIEQQLLTFRPKYFIYRRDTLVAEIVKKFTLFCPSYTINGPDWEVEGDFFDHEYEIKENSAVIASVSKEWFTFGDAYEITIEDHADVVSALAVVLVIDACLDAK